MTPLPAGLMSVNSGMTSRRAQITDEEVAVDVPAEQLFPGHRPALALRRAQVDDERVPPHAAARAAPPSILQIPAYTLGANAATENVWCHGMLIRSVAQVALVVGDMPSRVQTDDVMAAACSRVKHTGSFTQPCEGKCWMSAPESGEHGGRGWRLRCHCWIVQPLSFLLFSLIGRGV